MQESPQYSQLTARSHLLLRKVFSGDNGIEARHLAVSPLSDAFQLTPDILHQRFTQHAPALSVQCGESALENASLSADSIDAVIISTCTGYLCPGLTSYVSEALGLRPDVIALDLVGQGCGAALPNLRTAEALISSGRAQHVLSICVEVCSAAFYLDDNPGVLISTCLFGDGAAAAILSSSPSSASRRIEWHSFRSHHSPLDREALRFEQRGGMLRNILTRDVPALAGRHASSVLKQSLKREGLSAGDITTWVMHAGGKEVLAALRRTLELSEMQLSLSATVLREHGNLSSPFVLFVLQKALADQAAGGWWWMSSFGAGFSCHGALLRVD